MEQEDLAARYRSEAEESVRIEAEKRLEKSIPAIERIRLQAASLKILVEEDVETFIKACFVRLGPVAAALDGHGGGIALVSHSHTTGGLDLVLDLTGACLSCGAAPGTLSGVKEDLEADEEISLIKFSVALLDTFDELGREFILAHGNVDFV
jgi:Fe-S cluster biogenesis protein NfuA